MVTWENYEEYMVLMADGELDAAGQKELEVFMQQHPELREELALYDRLHLSPDVSVVFEGKEKLLRTEPKARTISFGGWRRYSAAAAILLLLGFAFMRWGAEDTAGEPPVVSKLPAASAVPTTRPADTIARPKQEPQLSARQKLVPQTAKAVPMPKPQPSPFEDKVEVVLPERIELVKVEMPVNTPISATNVTRSLPQLPEVNKPAPEQAEPELLAWLPINDEKKEGLNTLSAALSQRFDKVREIRNNLKNTDLAVKLGNKELFTVRF